MVIIGDSTFSVKFYKNKNLKVRNDGMFKVYVQVVYKTKSTKFYSGLILGQNDDLELSSDILKLRNRLYDFAKKDILDKRDEFNIIGFATRFRRFHNPLPELTEDELNFIMDYKIKAASYFIASLYLMGKKKYIKDDSTRVFLNVNSRRFFKLAGRLTKI